MKYLLVLLLVSCGAYDQRACYVNGADCPKAESHTLTTEKQTVVVKGEDGKDGKDGADGVDGKDGTDGEDAPLNPYDVVEIVDPCGDSTGVIDEVLLVLANGQVLVSVSENVEGRNTRLSVLPPGTYTTTDGSACEFIIESDGAIYYAGID